MKIFRNRRVMAINAIVFTLLMVLDMAFATVSLALTGGPSQPEVSSFTPVTTSDLVNLSSGDFNYNIPLLDVGGYPINISYNSGISMDEEASWVGLGWNVNPGVINRNMRALPDDFNGLGVKKEFKLKKDETYGVTAGINFELFGAADIGLGLGVKWNNYNGVGVSTQTSVNASMTPFKEKSLVGLDVGLSINTSNDTGFDVRPSVGLSSAKDIREDTNNDPSINVGLGFNSREGFKALSLSGSIGSSAKAQEANAKHQKTHFGEYKARNAAGKNGSTSFSSGTTVSLVPNTYSPVSQNSRKNLAMSFNIKAGPDVFGGDVSGHLEAYYSRSELNTVNDPINSYGYLYEQNSISRSDQHDFNREKDGPYDKFENRLPLTNQTYDIFSASGQGMSGMFRPYRNDVGVVHDPLVQSFGVDGSGGLEVGFPAPSPKIGGDATVNFSSSHVGPWRDMNDAADHLKFERIENSTSNFEPSYFREVGELAVDDEMFIDEADGNMSFLEKIGGFKPVRVNLKRVTGRALESFTDNTGVEIEFPTQSEGRFKQTKRKKRNRLFSYLSVGEALNFGVRTTNLSKRIIYTGNTGGRTEGTGRVLLSNTNNDPTEYKDQLGEISITQNDGSRYIYGKPLYNTMQEEVTFNASSSQNVIDVTKGTVSHTATDASTSNSNGLDNYYSRTSLPPYAHSFMITEILSSDYSDSDNIEGPSKDDYGNYTLFNYEEISDYKWRTPYADANHNEGFKSVETDDQGTYIYGEKDIAYLESIQTKTHVALFHKSYRHDALGASGQYSDGSAIGTDKMLKLDSIQLFTTADYNLNQSQATPIKTVHFEYDYFLGTGLTQSANISGAVQVPNNDGLTEPGKVNQGGKLTLRSVYFTYRNSYKAKFSKYDFDYENNDPNNNNFPYDIKAYDVWGNYKPSGLDETSENNPNTMEFPYVKQFEDPTNSDLDVHDYASAWHLSKINLPSGGTIEIEFESDDYLYVQDKRAMQMFRVMGAQDVENSSDLLDVWNYTEDNLVMNQLSDELYTQGGDKEGILWTCVGSDMPLTRSEWNKAVASLNNSESHLQFRYLVNVFKDGSNQFEYVSGYGKLGGSSSDVKFVPDCSDCPEPPASKYAWVKLKGVNLENLKDSDSGDDHPVSKAAWNFTRKYLPKKAYNQPEYTAEEVALNSEEDFFTQLAQANILGPLKEALKGPNGYLKSENKSRTFKKGRSWIRLNCPKDYKFGGGSRVKSIVSNDNWTVMSGDPTAKDSQFGQEYIYQTEKGTSSGVAAFEPLLSKENPFVVPVEHTKRNRYTLPNMKEEPIGVSFFPSPTVTYARVVVRDIIFENNVKISPENLNGNVISSRTGYTVNEFYTTKDFPTKVTYTGIDAVPQRSSPIGGLLQVNQRNLMAVSQGYQIEINDMDGKPKSTRIYGENQNTAISGVDYLYENVQQNASEGEDVFNTPSALENISTYSLNNDVIAINSDASIERTTVGVEVDVVSDFRESYNYSRSVKTKGNMSLLYALLVPVPVPTIFPNTSQNRTRFRSSVMTKVVNRRGILRETVAFDNGAAVSTKNLAYDANTGQVLLTSTKNEFGDEIFNLNAPAYWAYEEMGQSYENIRYKTEVTTNDKGKILSGDSPYLVYGDELLISDCVQKKGWIWHTQNGTSSDDNKYIIDAQGTPIEIQEKASIMVMKSGYRNMHGASMTSMTLMRNPLLDVDGELLADGETIKVFSEADELIDHKVIDVSAIEYSDRWKGFDSGKIVDHDDCDCSECVHCSECPECPNCLDCGCIDCNNCDEIEMCWTSDLADANFTLDDVLSLLITENTNAPFDYLRHTGFKFNSVVGGSLWNCNGATCLKPMHGPMPSFPGAAFFEISSSSSPTELIVFPNNQLNNNVNDLSNNHESDEFMDWFDIRIFDYDMNYMATIPNVIFQAEVQDDLGPTNDYLGTNDGFDNDFVDWGYSLPFGDAQWNSETGEFFGNSLFTQGITIGNNQMEGPTRCRISWGGTFCHLLSDNDETSSDELTSEGINPFVQNFRGQYRPISSYAYLGEREYQHDVNGLIEQTDIKSDGVYYSFRPYWSYTGSELARNQWKQDLYATDWTWTSSISNFNPYGPEVENVNALGQLSSALFGYNQTVPTAVAANASYNQIAFDNFEQYLYGGIGGKHDNHFSFKNYRWQLDPYEVHTGRYSLRIPASGGDNSNEIRCVRALDTDPSDNYCTDFADPDPEAEDAPFYLRPCDELGLFGPQTYDAGEAAKIYTNGGSDFSSVPNVSQQYVLSYWIHEKFKKFDMNSSEAEVIINGSVVAFDSSKESEIIEGWKKYDHVFTIPADATGSIEVVIRNNRTQQNIYVDDLRIHPYEASMKSYVYDPETLRLTAELDDNNFATFYEYDEEGRLLRIKKETERGIVTIQESKTSTHKTAN